MNLCVFQGTFNPIHKAHINVAEFALKHYGFDKILFIPAFIPPHKDLDEDLAQHRYNMVKLAIEGYTGFEISDIEYRRKGNSYTYLTILELKNLYNIQDKINFLIGTDAFEKIDTWYQTDKLKELVHFIVYKRCENFEKSNFNKFEALGYDFEFSPMEYFDVSSTFLRDNINTGNSFDSMLIPKVEEYIKENGLYS